MITIHEGVLAFLKGVFALETGFGLTCDPVVEVPLKPSRPPLLTQRVHPLKAGSRSVFKWMSFVVRVE